MVPVEKFEYPEAGVADDNHQACRCKGKFDEKEDPVIFCNEDIHEGIEFAPAIVDYCHCKKGIRHA